MTASKKDRVSRILRVNTTSLTHTITPAIKPVPKKSAAPTTALPPTNDLFLRPVYVPGDGERMRVMRVGAEDHLLHKSKTSCK